MHFAIAPNISPTDITTRRSSDGTSIVIVWRKVSLEESHGYFEYIIVLDAVNSRRKQSSDITVHVPFNKTSINVTGLNPQLTYTLTMRIAVHNERGVSIEGPISIPIRILSHCKYYPIQSYITNVLYISVTTPLLPASTNENSNTRFIITLTVTSAITLIVIVVSILSVVFVIMSKKKKSKYNLRSG